MINRIISFVFIVSLLFSCSDSSNEQKTVNIIPKDSVITDEKKDCYTYLKKAKDADQILLNATAFNKTDAINALTAFDDFTNYCLKDTLVPIFLLKGAQVAQSINDYLKAENLLKKCVNDYPQFVNRGAAMFLLAQLYDTADMLNNEDEAKKIYQQIIKEYPKTSYANDAKASLNNLGKTDEQLIQEFLKKNQ